MNKFGLHCEDLGYDDDDDDDFYYGRGGDGCNYDAGDDDVDTAASN